GKEIMEEVKTPEVLDAALIVAAQKVEHYEISSYGSLRALADALGHKNAAKLLQETLNEESATDEKLNMLAVGEINKKAMQQAKKAAGSINPAGAAARGSGLTVASASGCAAPLPALDLAIIMLSRITGTTPAATIASAGRAACSIRSSEAYWNTPVAKVSK